MPIPVIRSSMPPYEEYCKEIRTLWDSRWLTNMGEKHQKFEHELKDYLSVPNITLFTNGHSALVAALAAMDMPKGGEVITTPFTFASTTHAIVQNGLVPVFCDIDPDTFTIDAGKIEALITNRTCAILPVHVYGNMCDVHEIQYIADKHRLKVIYDAAHAFGVTYQGVGAANFGDAAMFSFHATKVFHTIEGGAVAFRDRALRKKLDMLKNFGITGPEDVLYVGGNAKMNEFQAAMGLCNLRYIDKEIEKRRVAVERYRSQLEAVPGIQLNAIPKEIRSNYAYFPVLFNEEVFGASRDEVAEGLATKDIFVRKYFYPLTNTFECYAGSYDAAAQTPVALRVSGQVLCLPLYAELSPEEVDCICKNVLDCRK